MKEGSSDIPALKFMIISDYITFNESNAYFNITLSKYSFAPFSIEDVVSTFSSRYRERDIIKLTKAKTIEFTGKKED